MPKLFPNASGKSSRDFCRNSVKRLFSVTLSVDRIDDKICDLVVEFHLEVVSFHFGLPEEKLVRRVRDTGAKLVSSATSVKEARWLEDRGCNAIVAQGYEASWHFSQR
jgi:NAD(P)H-dependent flavin oxidoreductase YrpB (nitropropane dioxygenase family)